MPRTRSKPLPPGIHSRTHRSGAVTYSIDYRDAHGRRRQEAAGSSIAEAVALLTRRRREAAEGALPDERGTGALTLSAYAVTCFGLRAEKGVRTVHRERQLFRDHCEPHLGAMRLDAIQPRDVERWIDTLTRSGTLSPKSILNTHGVLGAVLQRARFDGVIQSNPARDLPRGVLPRNVRRREVGSWTRAEVETLISDERIPEDRRVAYAIASFSGARLGEIAGLRWRDLDTKAEPLWRWALRSQYDGVELKTERPRDVPIHPELRRVLAAWKVEGWPRYMTRHPRPDDFVVPRPDGTVHSDNSLGSKSVERHCAIVGVDKTGRDFHSFRRFFVTHARTDGAREMFLERVTHNAAGTMLDRYTYAGWAELCEAVTCLRLTVRRAGVAVVVPLARASGATADEGPEAHRVTLDGDARGDASSKQALFRPKNDGGGGSRTTQISRQSAGFRGKARDSSPSSAEADPAGFQADPAVVPIAVTRVTEDEGALLRAAVDVLHRHREGRVAGRVRAALARLELPPASGRATTRRRTP